MTRWLAYGSLLPSIPEVGAVCEKDARTDLGGGREVTRVPTAKRAICCIYSQTFMAHCVELRGAKVRTRTEQSGHAESVGMECAPDVKGFG